MTGNRSFPHVQFGGKERGSLIKENTMKRIHRTVALAISGFLALAFVAGCGYEPDYGYTAIDPGELPEPAVSRDDPSFRDYYPTLEPYDEPVTVTVAAIEYALEADVKPGTTPENQAFNEIAKKYLNIDLEYTVVAASSVYDQKLSLAIASKNTPDMFYTTTPALFTSLRDSGSLADLSDYFYMLNDELLENYLTYMPELLPTVMQEGHLYALPMLTNKYATAQRLYIRKDWLDIVGMDAPETVEDMIALGEAFVEHKDEIAAAGGYDARRVIPFTMQKEITWAGSYSAEGMFNAHGASLGSYFDDGSGNLISSTTSDGTKNALQTLHTMYEKGILDPDFTSKTVEQIQANIKAGYVGMVFGEWWMPKDAIDDNITSKQTADWTWVDIPSYDGTPALPVVDRVSVAGYNLVSKDCEHPEAIMKLINLFYDIYYSDDSAERYVSDSGMPLTLPANGFYYQFVPVKLWDGVASMREYERVQSVFDGLFDAGFYSTSRLSDGVVENVLPSDVRSDDYVIGNTTEGGTAYTRIIKRSIVEEIEGNETWSKLFNTMRTREKTLHFADGYPYYVAMRQGVANGDMTAAERSGWGIYHEMISPDGSYAYVVELTTGEKEAKYDEFYGAALKTMEDFGDYLNTRVNEIFTQIITGEREVSYFDTFVSDIYNKNGGTQILDQVNAWYDAQPKTEDD